MGIWECVCRNNAGFGVTVEQVQKLSIEQLFFLLKDIRQKYSIPKLLKYAQKYCNSDSMYKDMLLDSATIFNYVVEIKNNVEKVHIVDLGELFDKYDNIIFENGQGLLIDGDFDMVHGTPSKTGLYNVNVCLKKYGKTLDEAIYVTRPYLTRHGRGNFVEDTFYGPIDETNVHNQWQESIRYGRFDSVDDLVKRIKADCPNLEPHILVTHTNYTDGLIMTKTGDVAIKRLPFEKIYTSDNKTTVQE